MRVQYALGLVVKCGVVTILVLTIIAIYSNVNSSSYTTAFKSLPEHIPPQWQELCQFLEIKPDGVEGQFEELKYRIRGIGIVFRHGERSPLIETEESGCLPFREEDRKAFADYASLINSDDFQYFLRKDKQLSHLAEIPESSKCRSGQLTAEGALQHVALGKFLRSRYGGSNIFNSDSELNVTLTVSKYNRTLQSAIAFSSGFLYPLKTHIPQLYFKASNFTFMCTADYCACPVAKDWRLIYEKEHRSVFYEKAPAHLREQAYAINSFQTYKNTHDPFQIMDTSLGKYICRRRPLPCQDDKCVTFQFLSELLNYTTARGPFMYGEGPKYIAKKLQLVEAYGVLYHLVQGIRQLRKFPHTNAIKIFSGHDVTVGPILRVLQVPYVDFPRYVSRIVFEFFEDITKINEILIRVVYNGVDVTSKVQICEKLVDGLCPSEYFEKFLPQILKQLGAQDIKTFCSSSTSNV